MERGNYNNSSIQMSQESSQVVKLPLAPIGGSNATVSTRRGSSIFSPTVILDDHHHHNHHQQQPNPPPHQQKQLTCIQTETTPDPDPFQNSHETSTSSNIIVKYRECLKNHAAGMGAHVLDGCGEFMPGGSEGTPEFLKCAACDCHRNFHRKEGEGNNNSSNNVYQTPMLHNRHALTQQQQLQLLGKNSHSFSHGPTLPAMMNFGGGGGVESSSEDLNAFGSGSDGHAVMGPSYSGSRKRFRTKFSQEQKDKMHDFAEKMDWRMQKQNEHEVQQFCAEVGVKRQVFKVWMHNNKQAMKKRQIDF